MSWLKLSGTARLQSVAGGQKLSEHFDFRKYLFFRRDILLFAKNTLTVKFILNTLYIIKVSGQHWLLNTDIRANCTNTRKVTRLSGVPTRFFSSTFSLPAHHARFVPREYTWYPWIYHRFWKSCSSRCVPVLVICWCQLTSVSTFLQCPR